MRARFVPLLIALLPATAAAALPDGWVGVETCAGCHDTVVAIFAAGVHGRAMARRGQALPEQTCESCHGPGAEHAANPAATNIRARKGDSHAEASMGCLACHAAQHGGVLAQSPGHRRAAVACLDCHTAGHGEPAAEPLLARSRADACAPCHRHQAAQFNLPFAHRQGRTPFECMSCHSVHGGTSVDGRIEEPGRAACVTCHTEKIGPFVFSHPPREVAGCLACHRPHGSANPKLLSRINVTNLCLECHITTPTSHNLASPTYRQCQTCHTAVHGSQRDPRLFLE